MKIEFTGPARKALKRMERGEAERIQAAIAKLPAGDVKPLQGRADFRLRVGSWRVIFERSDETILIRTIRARGDVYKR